MQRRISGLQDHFIVCAYGRVGRAVVRELEAEGVPFVVIDSKESLEGLMRSDGVPYIIDNHVGSLTLHEALLRLLTRSRWADIATGYVSLSGFALLAPALESLQEFRLLFGSSRIAEELARELRGERYRASTRTVVERMLELTDAVVSTFAWRAA